MRPLITPRVNLNGTSKRELVHQQMEICQAIGALQSAMRQATPNGRDFQTVENGDRLCNEARNAFNDRYNALTTMFEEFQQLAIDIQKQGE